MRLIRLATALAVLASLAACSSAPMGASWSPLIDEPTPPFPYNSKLCP